MDYNELISCFQDTIKMSEDELQDATLEAIDNTCVLKENIYEEVFENSNVKIKERPEDADVFVEVNTTFATAKEYLQDAKVAVLNFANPIRPGGGVQNGAMAQEECLCRSSNLYCCLREEKVFEDYYLYHRKMDHYLSTDRLIYSKDITVFKNDNRIPALMPARNWFQVDVITCAAPYLIGNVNIDQNSLKRVFLKRIQNILDAAILNQVDTIILGAFGCGAFKNPPDLVAQAFYEVIYDWDYKKYFKRIVFAIKSTNMKCRNIEIFSKYFIIKSVSEECLIGDKQYFKQWQKTNPYFGKKFSVLGDSISTLEGCHPQGYKVFFKNINLNYSVGKVRWRPWAERDGRIATNATTFNREILIVEKANDGKPFELHTSYDDKEKYYRNLRNPWLFLLLMFALFAVTKQSIIFGIFALVSVIPGSIYQIQIMKIRKEAKTQEW